MTKMKPETPIWALLDVKPTTGAHGRKLFMLSSPLVPLAGMVANPSEVKALRAAQPYVPLKCHSCQKKWERSDATLMCYSCRIKYVEDEKAKARAEGMAQGRNRILDELQKQKGLFLGFDFEEWIAAKRKEAQKHTEGKE